MPQIGRHIVHSCSSLLPMPNTTEHNRVWHDSVTTYSLAFVSVVQRPSFALLTTHAHMLRAHPSRCCNSTVGTMLLACSPRHDRKRRRFGNFLLWGPLVEYDVAVRMLAQEFSHKSAEFRKLSFKYKFAVFPFFASDCFPCSESLVEWRLVDYLLVIPCPPCPSTDPGALVIARCGSCPLEHYPLWMCPV